MEYPHPADLLPHELPAVFIGKIQSVAPNFISCRATTCRTWTWPQLLEGSAQAAGLLLRLRHRDQSSIRPHYIVVGYDNVKIWSSTFKGLVCWDARRVREILDVTQFYSRAYDQSSTLILEATVALGPGEQEKLRGTVPG